MPRILPRTLFWQLVLGTALVQSVCLALFISYTVISQRNLAEAYTHRRIEQQLDRLAGACSKPLANGDLAALHDLLELSRISPTIQVARLTDLSGKTLAVSDSGRDHGLDIYEQRALPTAASQRQLFKIRNGQLEAVTPVPQKGAPVALLWLEPNHAVSLNALHTIVRIAVDYGLLGLLANILPLFLIVRTVTRPLSNLREATQSVMRNPDSYRSFPLPVTTTNEAGELTASFNIMVQELQTQRRGLLETLALLDSMLENAPIGFAFFDRDLRYIRLNQQFAEICGVPISNTLGQPIADICTASIGEELEPRLIRVFDAGGTVPNLELKSDVLNAEGVQRSWLMHFYPVRMQHDSIRWAGVIAVEVTDRLQAEEALRKTEKLAAAGRLAASIAHEINNPLEAVTNLLYLLGTHEPMDFAAKQFVSDAQSELARVSEITQQTLRFYRQSTLPSRTNVAEVLDSVAALYQSRILSARVTVIRKFRGTPEVFGFSGELRQLFANLIGNALDAMPNGGRLFLAVRQGEGRCADGEWSPGVRVSVSDTGTGMSSETRRRIFEAFFTTKEATGTGLGLWVSDEIIRKHRGTVKVKSRQTGDSGTSFMLFFPEAEMKNDVLRRNDTWANSSSQPQS